ncbi:unnamed protein product [Microthlaspi erraticum]|uniref:Arabidopsis retrotransposon Orf1 C-terminal domain-containing protein n=1 Tax=Microthlaspi erraticum TaxID=1685480 RepID=A0A6D2KAR5_9BRAS|nr:unnamed protein product [Microthlaspi erraticum]
MGHEEHGGTWHMEAAQLDTQRKKGEAILKTSSTVYSTNRSSSSTRPAKLQLDRAEKSKSNPKNATPHTKVMAFAGKDPLRAPISLALDNRGTMVSTTRGTLSRAAAEKAEGKKPVTEEGSGSRKSGSTVMKGKDYAEIFGQMPFVGTRYPDLTTMAELGTYQDCHYLFD